MTEAKVIFDVEQQEVIIQCTTEDTMKDICEKLSIKINKKMNIVVKFFDDENNICPECGQKIKFSNEKLDDLKSSNDEMKDSINGIKFQIDNIINITSINSVKNQLKNINMMLDMINEKIKKNNQKITSLSNDYNYYNNIKKKTLLILIINIELIILLIILLIIT